MTIARFRCLLAVMFLGTTLHAFGGEKQAAFKIVERRVAAHPPTLAVQQGDTLVIDWSTDEAVNIHLHGYDVLLALQPSASGQMRVVAGTLGRFPVSAHGFGAASASHAKHQHETPLIYLEVQPR